MNNIRFQKFEMKYGYYLPEDYKHFIMKYGGDTEIGSCRFEYPENIIKNFMRIPGRMDFHLIPFGDIGNGDYYCFYKYGMKAKDYYIGIWLNETSNFVILSSSFKGFVFKCLLDEYLSIVLVDDETDCMDKEIEDDALEKCQKFCDEFKFDIDKIKSMKNEFDYHRIMLEYDDNAVQSSCYIGHNLIKKRDISGFDFLNHAIEICPFYTAPYYLIGKTLYNLDKNSKDYFVRGLKTSLVITGYSYWQEDFIEIPEDVHREIALFADSYLGEYEDYFNKSLYNGRDPYDYELRLEMAERYTQSKNYNMAMLEYNNAIFSCKNKSIVKNILKSALESAKAGGLYYLTRIIESDIKKLR